jgi:hypothetical protein
MRHLIACKKRQEVLAVGSAAVARWLRGAQDCRRHAELALKCRVEAGEALKPQPNRYHRPIPLPVGRIKFVIKTLVLRLPGEPETGSLQLMSFGWRQRAGECGCAGAWRLVLRRQRKMHPLVLAGLARGPSAHGIDRWASTGLRQAPRQLPWMPGTRPVLGPRGARTRGPEHGRLRFLWVYHLFEPEH